MTNFVMTDIHGNLPAFVRAMRYIREKDLDYHIFFLGDAVDRGDFGWVILMELMNNPRVTYIKGNHEDLFVNAAREYLDMVKPINIDDDISNLEDIMFRYGGMRLYLKNGGLPTFKSWIRNGAPRKIVDEIDNLPIFATYEQFDMCHAGTIPYYWEKKNEYELLWNRRHFSSPWIKDRVLIHGHTPLQYVQDFLSIRQYDTSLPAHCIFEYAPNKICLDLATVETNRIVVFNLDANEAVEV